MSNWTHATIPDQDRTQREADRIERERGCQPFEFSLTPQERDVVQIARCEIHAFKHGRFVPGLVVTYMTEDDLTDSEKAAFGFGGAV